MLWPWGHWSTGDGPDRDFARCSTCNEIIARWPSGLPTKAARKKIAAHLETHEETA